MEMTMAVAELSTAMATQRTMEQMSVSVLKKVLDMNEAMGADMANLVKEMELSVNPNVGSLFDVSI